MHRATVTQEGRGGGEQGDVQAGECYQGGLPLTELCRSMVPYLYVSLSQHVVGRIISARSTDKVFRARRTTHNPSPPLLSPARSVAMSPTPPASSLHPCPLRIYLV